MGVDIIHCIIVGTEVDGQIRIRGDEDIVQDRPHFFSETVHLLEVADVIRRYHGVRVAAARGGRDVLGKPAHPVEILHDINRGNHLTEVLCHGVFQGQEFYGTLRAPSTDLI